METPSNAARTGSVRFGGAEVLDRQDKQFQLQKSVAKYTEQLSVTQKRLNAATLKVMDITPKQMIDARVILEAKRSEIPVQVLFPYLCILPEIIFYGHLSNSDTRF